MAPKPDQADREMAVNAAVSVVVQAPAGSGKTTLLSERYLRLLPTVEDPDQVLAITFTRAAASEMRSRILRALLEARDHKEPANPGEKQLLEAASAALACSESRGWNLLDDPQQLRIQTIDVLARQIAQQTPLTSRLGPGFSPTENAAGYYRRAASRTLRALKDRQTADPMARQTAEAAATLLRHRDNNLQHCADLLAGMLANRDQWGRLFPIQAEFSDDEVMDAEVRPRLEAHLRHAVESHLAEVRDLFLQRQEMCSRLLALLRFAASTAVTEISRYRDIQELPPKTADSVDQWLGFTNLVFTKQGDPRKGFNYKDGFPAGAESKAHKDAAKSLIEEICAEDQLRETLLAVRSLPRVEYTDEEWHVAKALFRLLQRAIVELKLLFAESGTVDFVEIGLAAQDALASEARQGEDTAPSDLALTLSGHYRHLLVDEFQDTSITQLNLLELLLKGWSGEPGRTVFFVGDPMQSIYLFRQAELAIFNKVFTDGIAGMDVKQATLRTNFRSQPALVEEHNRIFRDVFAGGGGVRFAESQSALEESYTPAVTWHFFRKPPKDADKLCFDKSADLVAEADQILQLVNRDRVRKVAILVRAKHHGWRIMQLLRKHDIPYRAIEMESLSDRQEVLDVFALTRALLHPADRVAWLSVLRAPWCGLSLAALDAIAGFDTNAVIPDALASRVALLPHSDQRRTLATYNVLQDAVAQRSQLRLPALVWNTWHQLNGPACINQEQRENVLTYFSMLERMDAEGLTFRCDSIQLEMDRLCARPDPDPKAHVEILTIHKSKGLEFDTVIVPQMHRCVGRERGKALEWMEQGLPGSEGETPWYLAPIAAKGDDSSALAKWISARRKEREYAEVKRLFYVAATRAKRDLHLLGSVEVGAEGVKTPPLGSLLRAAWCVAEKEAQAQMRFSGGTPVLELTAAADEPQKILRLPQDWFSTAPISGNPGLAADPVKTMGSRTGKPREVMASRQTRMAGTALHLLLEQAASRRMRGESWQEIASWGSAAKAALQTRLLSMGMPASELRKTVAQAVEHLSTVLASPIGQWVLERHAESRSEVSLAVLVDGAVQQVRLDRAFVAGSEALSTGSSDRWIIDYKSASPQDGDTSAFLATQALAYEPTMLRYAEALRAALPDSDLHDSARPRPVHYALYFPAINTLHELGKLV
jgi:ATP-dependent exoDNAse (exonuclease V) beta subunit